MKFNNNWYRLAALFDTDDPDFNFNVDPFKYSNLEAKDNFDFNSSAILENEILGKGNNATVVDNEDRTVTKFYNGKVKPVDLLFYMFCKNNPTPVFPTVYEIGEDYITMEKLNCHTDKCKKCIEALDEDFHGRTVWEWACDELMPRSINRTPELQFRAKVLNWCLTLKTELDKINDPRISLRQCDLTENNIGERENGEIVIFDI